MGSPSLEYNLEMECVRRGDVGGYSDIPPHAESARSMRRSAVTHHEGRDGVNAYEQLEAIHYRLELNGANEDTITLVEKFLKRAESERESQTSVPQVMMLRHLLRQKEALDSDAVYNDLQELMSEHEDRRPREDDVRPAYEDTSHQPRPRSYYRALKEKERHQP
jgi:hypothetical protein